VIFGMHVDAVEVLSMRTKNDIFLVEARVDENTRDFFYLSLTRHCRPNFYSACSIRFCAPMLFTFSYWLSYANRIKNTYF
jgi:hypothetical protein